MSINSKKNKSSANNDKQEELDKFLEISSAEEIVPPNKVSLWPVILVSIFVSFSAGFFGLALFLSGSFNNWPLLSGVNLQTFLPERQIIIQQKQSVTVTQFERQKQLVKQLESYLVTVVRNNNQDSSELAVYNNNNILGFGVVLSADGWIVTLSEIASPKDLLGSIVLGNNGKEYEIESVVVDHLAGVSFIKLLNTDDLRSSSIGSLFDQDNNSNLFSLSTSLPSGKAKLSELDIDGFTERQLHFTTEEVARELVVLNSTNSDLVMPVFNLEGELVGFTHNLDSVNYILPSDYFSGLIDTVLTHEKVLRASLGIEWVDLHGSVGLSSKVRQGFTKGAYIVSVRSDSVASKAGLKEGDVVLRVNDYELNGERNLTEFVASAQPGDIFILDIVRASEEMEVIVTLGVLEELSEI